MYADDPTFLGTCCRSMDVNGPLVVTSLAVSDTARKTWPYRHFDRVYQPLKDEGRGAANLEEMLLELTKCRVLEGISRRGPLSLFVGLVLRLLINPII